MAAITRTTLKDQRFEYALHRCVSWNWNSPASPYDRFMNAASLSAPQCPLCCEWSLQPGYTLDDANGVPSRIWQCHSCFCQVPESRAETPGSSSLLNYRPDPHEQAWSTSSASELDQLRVELGSMLECMAPQFGPPLPGRLIVEIGCGRGGLLRALLDRGYDAIGCEPSARLVAQAFSHYDLEPERLMLLAANPFLDVLDERNIRPHVIVLWHVLEHVQEPLLLLQRCARMLAPEGRLVLQVPMLACRHIFPEHFFFLTPQTLPALSRRLGGLPFRYIVDDGNQYLSIFLGTPFAGDNPVHRPPPDPGWESSFALAEPICTRDRAINNVTRALAESQRMNADLRARILDLERSSGNATLALSTENSLLSQEVESLHQIVAESDGTVQELRDEVAGRDLRIGTLEAEGDRQRVLINDGQLAVDGLTRQVEQREASLENLRLALGEATDAMEESRRQADELAFESAHADAILEGISRDFTVRLLQRLHLVKIPTAVSKHAAIVGSPLSGIDKVP